MYEYIGFTKKLTTLKFSLVMKLSSNIFLLSVSCLILITTPAFKANAQSSDYKPVRIAVAGITHGHAGFILGRKPKPDIAIVGVYEPDTELAKHHAKS